MAHHHHMFDLDALYRELNGGECIQVGVHHHIGDVAVHEHLARVQTGDFIGGHAAVGAAYPHVLGALLVGQVGEKAGPSALDVGSPGAVVGK